ncbi:MAG TPA: histidinol-phosphate transaminase [Solirubrobacteraceae bacterium]|nr:histidinol-phosphate transaminase [Solirubrobacteraceae bacterium]
MKRRLLDYYRQFEAISPEEDSRRLRERREAEKSLELERVPPLDLSRVEWHEPPDPEIVNAATFALRRAINRYPEADGGEARQAIARRHGVALERVALGHGAGQLLQGALREAAGGGDALMPWPAWSPLPALMARAGVRPVAVPLNRLGRVDFDALAAATGPDTRAVVLCNPNDPTGAPLDVEALRAYAGGLRPDVTVLVDEALVDLAGEGASALPLVDELPNLLVFRSFSKAWAMAGLRAGYVVAPAGDEDLVGVLSPGQGVAAPTQAAVAAALENADRAEVRLERRRHAMAAERARLAEQLAGTPFQFAPSAANFVWLRGEGTTAAAISHGLADQRIAVATGWGDDAHVRITLRDRAATDRLASALRALAYS